MLSDRYRSCHTLPHPRVASAVPLWLDRTDFQTCMSRQMFCAMLQSELCNYGVGFVVLTEELLTLGHT